MTEKDFIETIGDMARESGYELIGHGYCPLPQKGKEVRCVNYSKGDSGFVLYEVKKTSQNGIKSTRKSFAYGELAKVDKPKKSDLRLPCECLPCGISAIKELQIQAQTLRKISIEELKKQLKK